LWSDFCWKTFQREDRKGEELNAIDIFKATHNSRKDGFSPAVKDAIVSHLQVCGSFVLFCNA
jgi:hypothetical protein